LPEASYVGSKIGNFSLKMGDGIIACKIVRRWEIGHYESGRIGYGI
jgi:hypothetical protein